MQTAQETLRTELSSRGIYHAKRRRITKKTLTLYLLFAPAVILLFLFNYMPMYGIIISFKEFTPYRGIWGSDWVGLEQFKYFFTDPKFWSVVKNTIIISLMDIGFGFPAPIIFIAMPEAPLMVISVFRERSFDS